MKKVVLIFFVFALFFFNEHHAAAENTRNIKSLENSAMVATDYYVSTFGSDSNPGTFVQPWRTINYGVNKLKAGDTLNIREGTYYERVYVHVNGTKSQYITIQSYPNERAIIDSGTTEFRTPGNSDWVLVNPSLGEYESRSTYSRTSRIYAYLENIPNYINGRVALVNYYNTNHFRSTTDQYVDGITPFYVGPGVFRENNKIHIRLAKTTDMKSAESRYGPILDSENPTNPNFADPRQYSIILSDASTTVSVYGSYINLKNLTINQALESLKLFPKSSFINIEGTTVWNGDSAIEVRNAHDINISRSRIYGDHPYWIFWSDMKNPPAPADYSRGTSIDLRDITYNVEVSYSHIRGNGQDLIGVNTNETNVSIHHNRIENCGDDAFELEGTLDLGAISIYENYIENCLVGVAPGQDTPSFAGPLYVYRNVFVFLRNPPINRKPGINTWNFGGGARYGFEYMLKHSTSSSDNSKNTHYYHNTMVLLNHGGKGLNIIPKTPDQSVIVDNIMVMVNGLVNRDYRISSNPYKIDADLYWKINNIDTNPLLSTYNTVLAFSTATGFEQRGIGDISKIGTDPLFTGFIFVPLNPNNAVWEPINRNSEHFKPSDFFLKSESRALGTGIQIPNHPVTGKSLPDSRNSLDLGAIPSTASPSEYDVFPFIPDESQVISPVCVDTDSSTYPTINYTQKGTVSVSGQVYTYEDTCDITQNILTENYCNTTQDTSFSLISFTCPQGCPLNEGRCRDIKSPIIISGPVVPFSFITPNSARIEWETDEMSNSIVYFSVSPNGEFLTATDNLLTTHHSVLLDSLSPTTDYYYKVSSVDQAGNPSLQISGAPFTTLPEILKRYTPRLLSPKNVSNYIPLFLIAAIAALLIKISLFKKKLKKAKK